MIETYSVIVPAYNAEKTISNCLSSVFKQTFAPCQVIVVDDCSIDATEAAVRAWSDRFTDSGIEFDYCRQAENAGPSSARNWGMSKAVGSYLAFLDADDIWAADKLAVVDRFARSTQAALLWHEYTDVLSLPSGSEPADYHPEAVSAVRLLVRNQAQTSCVVLRKLPDMRFETSMRYCEDYDLWLRIAEKFGAVALRGPPLTRLGRPQLSEGGLSANTIRMRTGEMRVYYNFCRRAWIRRALLLPALVTFSAMKHVYSVLRRRTRKFRRQKTTNS